jgi:type VI protein secretion system component VasF
MKLNELAEPLFTYICRLNRTVRLGGPAYDAAHVRTDIDAIFKKMEATAESCSQGEDVRALRLPLMFFVDYMISSSALPWAQSWPRMAHEVSEFAGDEKFFHPMLDEMLEDSSPDATERAEVFYSCMSLGMTGIYADRPDEFQALLAKVASRIRDRMDGEDVIRVCPDAYKYTDKSELFRPVSDRMGTIAIATLGLLAAVFVVTGVVYMSHVSQVNKLIKDFISGAPASGSQVSIQDPRAGQR